MEKIKLLKPLWNAQVSEIITVDELRAQFALRKKYAVKVEEEIKQPAPENKAERKPRKNKANAD